MNIPSNEHHSVTMYGTINRSFFCLYIPSRIGVLLVLTVWIALSVFLAAYSFMNQSLFFSHVNEPATLAFGIIHVVFVLVLLSGCTFHVCYRSMYMYRQYAKVFAWCVAIILMDMFANCVLFAVQRDDFLVWCSTSSNDEFEKLTAIHHDPQVGNTLEFNCGKLHTTEAKFSFGLLICFIIGFSASASFIVKDSKNFVMIPPEISNPSKLNMVLPTTHINNDITLSNMPPQHVFLPL